MSDNQTEIEVTGEEKLGSIVVENDFDLYKDLAHTLTNHKHLSTLTVLSTMLMALAVVAEHDKELEDFISKSFLYYCDHYKRRAEKKN